MQVRKFSQYCCRIPYSIFQGIRKFGKNFSAIASILGTKTESHVRSFFVNYRRRYDLDSAYKVLVLKSENDFMFLNVFFQEYEAEFGPSEQSDVNDKEETEVFFHLPEKIDFFKLFVFF